MIVLELLTKELGLPITPYERTFRWAAGHVGHFIGKLGPVKVQVHNGLEQMLGGIRVIAAADNTL